MHRAIRFILPLLIFAAGLATGAWFGIGHRAAGFAAGVDRRLAEAVPATPAPAPIPAGMRAFPTDDEMLTAIMSAVTEKEPLLRAHHLHEVLGRLGPVELAALFARAVQTNNPEQRGELLATLLARWFAIDPVGAEAAARPYRERSRAKGEWDWRAPDNAVSLAWAQVVPDLALAQAMAAPDAPWSRMIAWGGMDALAGDDPARRLEVIARLPVNRLRTTMCAEAITALAEKDATAAEAALDLMTDPRKRANLQATILGKLTERDPQAGLARLATLAPDLTPGGAGTRLVVSILGAAAAKDATAALAAIDGLPEELRAQARNSVVAGWAGVHPLEALQWAEANGMAIAEVKTLVYYGDSDGGGWNTLMGIASNKDRDKVLAWIRAQPASPERDAMLRDGVGDGGSAQRLEMYAQLTPEGRVSAVGSVVTGLYQEDRDRALAWTRDLPPGPERIAAVRSLVNREVFFASDRLDALVNEWPAGPDRDAALGSVSARLVQSDPVHALDFARRVSDPVTRETAFYQLASSWYYRDQTAVRTWLAGTTELPAESKRVLLRQFDER